MNVDISKLTTIQIKGIVKARRELPIPSLVKASSSARILFLKKAGGHEALNKATNAATRVCKLTQASTTETITLQVAAEELTMAEGVKNRLTEDEYQLLTFPFRSVLEPLAVTEKMRKHLGALKLPETEAEAKATKAAPKPTAAPAARNGRGVAGNRPNSAAGRKRAAEAAKPPKHATIEDIRKLVAG